MGVLASAPVLVALAFLMAASLDFVEPGLGAAGRDANPRAVSRPLTVALARAVRGLVGVATQRPVAGSGARCWAERGSMAQRPSERRDDAGPEPLREGLLNLPPPSALA
jgi:hypothetical protein